MIVQFDKNKQRKPIKIWLENYDQVESGCQEQVENLSNLPFVYKWPALMPDCHQGYGMPIGGVIATDGVIIPNAVGVDIGCGMCFVQTNIPAELLRTVETGQDKLIKAIIGAIMRNIPVGFTHHKEKQECKALDRAQVMAGIGSVKPDNIWIVNEVLYPEIEAGYYQVGTLGGGNHFIEIQEDEEGMVGLMLHSGSRNFGFKICKYFNSLAKEYNQKWFSIVTSECDLAFLPIDTVAGQQYFHWMQLAMDFAKENREQMMWKVKEIMLNMVKKCTDFTGIELGEQIGCHHNYAVIEHHFGKNVWVHRKGAIRTRQGDIGIIPGSMGSYSYIVEGLGCPDSFCSSSHGAGRNSSRKKAKETYSVQKVIEDLKDRGVTLGKQKKEDVAEECRMAYKDIDLVIRQESDLVRPIKRLKTIGVVKG
jgi:tRNA-splicing ligase RtcB